MSAERLSPESSLTGLCSLALVSPTRTMRVIPLLAAFVFLGIAAAGAIPEVAAVHDIVPDGKYGRDLGLPTETSLIPIPRATPPDVAGTKRLPPDVAWHAKHTGKHSRSAASCRDGTLIFLLGSSSGDSYHHNKSSKKGKHYHSTTSQGAKPTNVGSHTPPLPTASVHAHHSYTPTSSSDHSKYTGKPSRRLTYTSGLDPTESVHSNGV
ncbi:hypothetical protein L210DRAFT_2354891 [Boletus edulis BED1]|uniref:Uncharacterized protein n=1 Tax=Boletus edulis BED1 TaxID=1328754 RepID=A0AAD4BQY8_BOLED|nr:hypothetical protein L210DRAFT_2354891 [Boletus edulis BED1]